jgi:hypothetical protein
MTSRNVTDQIRIVLRRLRRTSPARSGAVACGKRQDRTENRKQRQTPRREQAGVGTDRVHNWTIAYHWKNDRKKGSTCSSARYFCAFANEVLAYRPLDSTSPVSFTMSFKHPFRPATPRRLHPLERTEPLSPVQIMRHQPWPIQNA